MVTKTNALDTLTNAELASDDIVMVNDVSVTAGENAARAITISELDKRWAATLDEYGSFADLPTASASITDGTVVLVYADSTASRIGFYRKVSSPAHAWERIQIVPDIAVSDDAIVLNWNA